MAKKSKKAAYKAANVAIHQISLADKEVYATWNQFSSAQRSNMSGITVTWKYKVTNSEGKQVWFSGNSTSVGSGATQSETYSAPNEAIAAGVWVTPVLTKKGKKKATASTACVVLSFDANAPEKPSGPEVSVEGYTLTLSIETTDPYAKSAVFYLYRDAESDPYWSSEKIQLSGVGIARHVVTLAPGHEYYAKVQLYNEDAGSELSDAVAVSEIAIPEQVQNVVITPLSQTQIQISWDAVTGAASSDGYEIEYATDTKYYGGSNSQTTNATNTTEYLSLDVGNVWYFRIRAVNSNGISGAWSDPPVAASVAIKPNPPTTWTMTNSAYIDSTINLYWTHNSADGAKPTKSQIEWSINDGTAQTIEITHSLGPDDTDFTFHKEMELDSSTFSDGDILKWRVRTQGIEGVGWSDYSVLREVRVYAPLSLSIAMSSTITAFPIELGITVEPATQEIVSFFLVIKARDSYDDSDYMGEFEHITAGQTIFSKHYSDLDNIDTISFLPSDINLVTDQTYDVEAVVATSAGLTASDTTSFTMDVEEPDYYLDMGMSVDMDSLSAALVPGCYSDISQDPDGDDIYDLDDIVEGVTFDIYRINFDGSFTAIQKGLENDGITIVSDPHPALDNGKYRLVATDSESGMMFYTDIISEDLDIPGMVLQWDAKYANYLVRDIVDDLDEPAIGDMTGGTTLKLPYNVKKNEDASMDVSLVEYIGRESPVSYYGTQKGQTASYSSDVPKEDLDTLDLLRKLQVWPGDVYVRGPEGIGYWANVTVSFSRDYDSVIMPVNIEVTRVDSERP